MGCTVNGVVVPCGIAQVFSSPLQTIRADIRCEHAARAIDNKNDIFAEALARFLLLSPLWPGERDPDACNCNHQQRILEQPAERAVRAGQLFEEAG